MIDVHSHIVPTVDDGAQNIDVSIDMIKNAKNITYFSGKSNYSKVHRFLCLVFYNILCAWKARKSEHIWFYNIVLALNKDMPYLPPHIQTS